MKDTRNGSEDWLVLCELASKEADPKKLLDLITKINQALRGTRLPLSADLSYRGIAAVFTQPVQYDC